MKRRTYDKKEEAVSNRGRGFEGPFSGKGDSNQQHIAQSLGISPQYLSDVLKGRRAISEQLAKRLGYRRHVTFEEI